MTISNKITTLFTSLTAIITLLLSVLIYFFTQQYIERDFFQRMQTRAGVAAIANFEAGDHNMAFYNDIREKHLQRLPEEKETILLLPLNQTVIDSMGFGITTASLQNLPNQKLITIRKINNYFLATLYQHDNRSYAVLLSAYNQQGAALLTELQKNLLLGFLVSVIVVFIISLLLARQVVSPIRHIILNAQKITASNLHLRLQPPKGKDETAALTQTFNDMLDRLETSFETQSNFLNKAAHELRTPLTAIIGEAELALIKPRTQAEYERALQVISREAEQLEHHTSSLLELAQAGYNSKEPFMHELRIDELLFSVKRLIDFSGPGNLIQIDLSQLPDAEDRITISGNANLLKLALANIIQNACKYSSGRKVTVSLSTDKENCIITIADAGIGIPAAELKYIFDPFFRASNTGPFKGYGVGLPLAQKIIRLHRGDFEYTSIENLGTTVRVFLPFIA
ncbi:MAG: ATP-binding protein [Agriterribacter sp.]